MSEEQRRADNDPFVDFVLCRVPFFLEPGYLSEPDSFRESHEERMIKKFGSKDAFERVKKSHNLGCSSASDTVMRLHAAQSYVLLLYTVGRGREAGLTAEMGFTQDNLTRRIQSATLRSHRLVYFVAQVTVPGPDP